MPTSAPGSSRRRCRHRRPGAPVAGSTAGFTLIELLIVIAIVALTTTMVALSLRDGQVQALEREADRLALLLETARADSRASGLPVWWRPADASADEPAGFRFIGLPAGSELPAQWLDAEVRAEVEGAEGGPLLALGPEALIGAQRVWLRLGERRIAVATDGLAPFEPQPGDAP